jgi:uncharacterized protein (TIGR03435 family)
MLGGAARPGAQTPAPQPRLAFDVASIKVNNSVEGGGNTSGPSAGHYTAKNIPLNFVVLDAYQLMGYQLDGLPDWVANTRYDIAGTYPPGLKPTEADLRAMVRSLLEDRFHFRAHQESRELSVYALTIARKDGRLGPQMTPSSVDCAAWLAAGRPQIGGGGPSAIAPGGKRPECLMIAGRRGVISAGTRPIKELTGALTAFAGRPVIDRTGLTGSFNMDMQWTPTAADPAGVPSGASTSDVGVSLFVALQEQLGLKLEAARAPFDILVVDHIEHPTEN